MVPATGRILRCTEVCRHGVWLFEGEHRRIEHVSGDKRDHFEATLLGSAIDGKKRVTVTTPSGMRN